MGGIDAPARGRPGLALGVATASRQNALPWQSPSNLPNSPFLETILELSRFDDDSAAALRALHRHFRERFPDCSLSLLLVQGMARGQCRLAGSIAADGREHVPNVDPLGQTSILPLFDDALTHRLLFENRANLVRVDEAGRTLPFAQALFASASLLGVPLVNSGAVTHWLVFGSGSESSFAEVDHDMLLLEVNLAASLIVRPIATRALRTESERHRLAIEGLADVQRQLLPDNPRLRGLDYAVHWQPAETAAGDYYDLMLLNRIAPAYVADRADIWGVMLADVSGHGAAAAMEAAQFDAILRTYQGDEDPGPAGALTYANRYFFSRRTRHHFLTALALLYRPDLGRAIYVSAGHPPLLHRRANGVVARSAGEQIPLGVLRDFKWANHEFEVAPGDVLVLYTDGIVEARDARGREFGRDRLVELVEQTPVDATTMLERLRAALFAHQGGPIGSDDQTLIILRIT